MIGDKSGSEFAKENLKMGGKMKFVIGIHIQRGQKRKVIDSTEDME